MQNPTMAGRDWLLLVTLSVLWGGSFFFSEVALGELGPFTVVLGRVGIAAAALVAFVYLSGRRLPAAPGVWGALTWAAVLGLALLSTALAYLIYFRILAVAGATNLLPVTFLIPVSALARYLRARRASGWLRPRGPGPDLRRPCRGRRPALRAPARRRR